MSRSVVFWILLLPSLCLDHACFLVSFIVHSNKCQCIVTAWLVVNAFKALGMLFLQSKKPTFRPIQRPDTITNVCVFFYIEIIMQECTIRKLRNTTVISISRIYHSLIILINNHPRRAESVVRYGWSFNWTNFLLVTELGRIIAVFKRSRHLTVPRVHIFTYFPFEIGCAVILRCKWVCTLSSQQVFFLQVFGLKCCMNFSCYMSSLSHSSLPNILHQNLRAESIKPLCMTILVWGIQSERKWK